LQTRPAALAALETVGLTGKGGVLSHTSPGVFLQVKNRVMWSIYVYPSWNLTDHIVWPNWCSKHSCKLNVNLEWYSCVAVSWMARHCNPYKRMWFFSHKKPWVVIDCRVYKCMESKAQFFIVNCLIPRSCLR
jgi:hypothetical protein